MKKQDTSGPEKKREDGHGKITEFIDIDMIRSDIYKDLTNSLITGQNPLQDKISMLDLPKLHTLTDNEKFHLLSVFFSSHDQKTDEIYFDRKNNKMTNLGLKYVNQLLNEAVDYYQNYLLRTVGIAFIQKWNKKKLNPPQMSFKDTKDVLSFFDAVTSEKNSTAYRQIDCSLLKIAVGLQEYKEYEKEFSEAETKFKDLKDKYFFPHFYDGKGKEIEENLDIDYIQLQTKSDQSNKQPIFFKTSWRIKDYEKIILKFLSNRKYGSMDAIHDIYGIRNEAACRKDALLLLEYLRLNIFKKEGTIIDKKIFVTDIQQDESSQLQESLDFINNHKNDLEPEFYNYLIGYLLEEKSKKESSNNTKISHKNYHDIKILGKLGTKKVEVQINLVNSKNERGFAHHLLYDAKIKIAALVRLQSYISDKLIYRYIEDAIDENIQEIGITKSYPELLQLGGFQGDYKKLTPDQKKSVITKIFTHMYKNEKAFLKLDLPGKQHDSIYTTIDHRNAYHQDDNYKKIYPDGSQVKFDGKWTNKKI